jgi:hypothetical protein
MNFWIQLAILVVTALIAKALAPKPPKPKPASLSDFDLPTAEAGRPLPVVFGTVTITGPNVVWYGDLGVESDTEDGVTYRRYFLGLHFGLCHGPVDSFYRVTVGSKQVWSGSQTSSGPVTLSQANLFGGTESEGGIAGTLSVMMGEDTQTANAYLTETQGTPQPAYRGILSLVYEGGLVSANTVYLKPWEFGVRRVLKGWADDSCWYPETGEIIRSVSYEYPYDAYAGTLSLDNRWRLGTALHTVDSPTEANVGTSGISLTAVNATTELSLAGRVVMGTNSVGAVRVGGGYFTASGVEIDPGDAFTVGAWVDLDGSDTGGWFFRSNEDANYPNLPGLTLGIFSDGYIRVRLGIDSSGTTGDNYVTYRYPTSASGVTFIAVTVSDCETTSRTQEFILYVDGIEVGRKVAYSTAGPEDAAHIQADLSDPAAVSGDLEWEVGFTKLLDWPTIGAGGISFGAGYGQDFVGRLDDVFVTGSVLSSATIALLNTYGRTDGDTFSLIDMNPAHIIYQTITEPAFGMGYDASVINDTSFRAAADTFWDEGMGLSLQWVQQSSVEEFQQIILDHCGAILRMNWDGELELKPIRGDYTPASLTVYDEEQIVAVESWERAGYGELVGEVTVVYNDQTENTQQSVTVQNLATIQSQSGVVAETTQYPGFSFYDLAARVAMRDLEARSTPLARGRIQLDRSAWGVLPGDVLKISWSKLGLTEIICRVLAADYGTLTEGVITLDVAEDVFGLPDSTYSSEQATGWSEPVISTIEQARLSEDGDDRVSEVGQVRFTNGS